MRSLRYALAPLTLIAAVAWWASTVVEDAAAVTGELDRLGNRRNGMTEWWHDPDGEGPLEPFPVRTYQRDYATVAEWIQAINELAAAFPSNADPPTGR